MTSLLSVPERERLYIAKKIVDATLLKWEWSNGAYRISAPVVCESGEELIIRAVYRSKRTRQKYSFGLYYRSVILVRCWDHGAHRNPDGERIAGSHKHPRSDKVERDWAYPVDDIPLGDPNESLFAFFEEARIEVQGNYQLRVF